MRCEDHRWKHSKHPCSQGIQNPHRRLKEGGAWYKEVEWHYEMIQLGSTGSGVSKLRDLTRHLGFHLRTFSIGGLDINHKESSHIELDSKRKSTIVLSGGVCNGDDGISGYSGGLSRIWASQMTSGSSMNGGVWVWDSMRIRCEGELLGVNRGWGSLLLVGRSVFLILYSSSLVQQYWTSLGSSSAITPRLFCESLRKANTQFLGGQSGRGDGWTVPSTIDLWKLACAVIQGTICTWMSTK